MVKSEVFNMDNLVFMRNCKDKQFDIAIVDPEYRDENQPDIANRAKGGFKTWLGAPKEEFFYQLFRISQEQIIFGGNYFTNILNSKTGFPFLYSNNNWYIWDKKVPRGLHYSQCEMAWVSDHILSEKKINTRIYRSRSSAESWHETGKPMDLYQDIYGIYIKPIREKLGRKISVLDTNLGSGSHRIVSYILGCDFTGLEINPDYFKKSCLDFETYKRNNSIFEPNELINNSIF